MLTLKNILLSKYFVVIALCLHIAMLFVLYKNFGFNFSNEADKYLTAAEKLSADNISDILRNQWFSTTYILFLSLFLKLGLSFVGILFVQFFFSLVGYYFFYKFLISQKFFSKAYSRICLLLIMCSPIILNWQLTLFSESFFIGLSMITTYFAFNSKTQKNLILTLVFSLFLLFCRPVGAFYVLALMYVVMKMRNVKVVNFLVGSSSVVLVGLILFVMPLHFNGIVLPVLQGSVICGFPLYTMNVDVIADPVGFNLIGVYSVFIQQNGYGALFHVFFQKFISFFTLTRPYYSTTHNVINAFHYVFLFVALYSLYDLKRKKVFILMVNYISLLIFSSTLLVVLFYNEWSERYIVPLFPFFILLFVLFVSKIRKPLAV